VAIAKKSGRKGLRGLDAVLPGVMKPAMRRFGFAEYRILSEWPKIVGEILAARTTPVRLQMPQNFSEGAAARQRGVLHIHALDSSVAVECSYLEPQIIERISVYFGFPAVGRLMIHHCPTLLAQNKISLQKENFVEVPLPGEIEKIIAEISDAELASSLRSLWQSMASRR
jgi:hypothetical protein